MTKYIEKLQTYLYPSKPTPTAIQTGKGMYDESIAAGRFRMIQRTEVPDPDSTSDFLRPRLRDLTLCLNGIVQGTSTTKLIDRLLEKLDPPGWKGTLRVRGWLWPG